MQQLFAAWVIRSNSSFSVLVPGTSSDATNLMSRGHPTAVAYAVNLLATHVPQFNSTEEEEPKVWIQTVERVAWVHEASDKCCYEQTQAQYTEVVDLNIQIESWTIFKTAFDLDGRCFSTRLCRR